MLVSLMRRGPKGQYAPSTPDPVGGCGWLVNLFFVISGFIMVYTTFSRPTRPAEFLCNRIARIVPLYWLMTLGTYSIAFVAPTLLQATSTNPLELLKSLFFVPFVKSNGLVQPVLFLGWTLNL